MKNVSLKDGLKTIILLITLSFIWNIVIPGIVAYSEGVFYPKDVEAKLPRHSPEALSKYFAYKKNQQDYTQRLSDIDTQIASLLQRKEAYSEVENLIKLRQFYKEELANLKSPIAIKSYYGDRTVYYAFTGYICLGFLALLLMPVSLGRLNLLKVLIIGLLLYVSWMSTGWLRNFFFYDEGRTVFSFVNYDIGHVSFFLQELRILGVCLFISASWGGWMIYHRDVAEQVRGWASEPATLSRLSKHAGFITGMFSAWQISFIAIGAAFLPWTFHYWVTIVKLADGRYVMQALVMHVYWIITWTLATAPLIYAYGRWSRLKAAILERAADSELDGEPDRSINLIKEINPLSSLQIVGAGVASVLSFLLPLKDLII
jgi:hypothetical protein